MVPQDKRPLPGSVQPSISPAHKTRKVVLPIAPTWDAFLQAGGAKQYAPRPEWYQDITKEVSLPKTESNQTDTSPPTPSCTIKVHTELAVFGRDRDHAIHVAARQNATAAVLSLLQHGVFVDDTNSRMATPLLIAAQKGNIPLVKALLQCGADPAATTNSGVTPLLQAAHFGRTAVVQILLNCRCTPSLIEMSTSSSTTPLMRAAQEGHVEMIRLLLRAGAQLNRRNRNHMTALMLASQRGHAQVCQSLIDYGAMMEAETLQKSTALLLACKRDHLEAVRVLVTAGCELSSKDSRGNNVRLISSVRKNYELARLLDPVIQVHLMQRAGWTARTKTLVRCWKLCQASRAFVRGSIGQSLRLENVASYLSPSRCSTLTKSTQALIRTMLMPESIMLNVGQYLPLPHMWDRRVDLLARRARVHPDDAVAGTLDLIEEVLEAGGFTDACDLLGIPSPIPTHFPSWRDWKAWGRMRGIVVPENLPNSNQERVIVTSALCPPPVNMEHPSPVQWRRYANFFKLLSTSPTQEALASVLLVPPYSLPKGMWNKLVHVSDLACLQRRMGKDGGIHFESNVALDLVMLASMLCTWYWGARQETPV